MKASTAAADGVLLARPSAPTQPSNATGKIELGLGKGRDGFLYVPAGSAELQRPLVVFFHGAGGGAHQADMLSSAAADRGVIILSLDSRGSNWDLLSRKLGPDIAFLDDALRFTFARYAVAPSRVAVSGFSDGASYALSVGLANGELFKQVLAFSPGFVRPPHAQGKPRVFVSHGTADSVLPIDACSRNIVPRLERSGYVLRYREFEGGHSVPPEMAADALHWMLTEAQG